MSLVYARLCHIGVSHYHCSIFERLFCPAYSARRYHEAVQIFKIGRGMDYSLYDALMLRSYHSIRIILLNYRAYYLKALCLYLIRLYYIYLHILLPLLINARLHCCLPQHSRQRCLRPRRRNNLPLLYTRDWRLSSCCSFRPSAILPQIC